MSEERLRFLMTLEPTDEVLAELRTLWITLWKDNIAITKESAFVEWMRKNKDAVISYNDRVLLPQQENELQKRQREANVRQQAQRQLLELANEALDYQLEQFDGDPEADLNVSGADLVEWFTDWRDRVHTVVRTIEGKTASSQQQS